MINYMILFMKTNERPERNSSSIFALFRFPGRVIDKFAWRFFNVDRYESVGRKIILHKGPFRKISIDGEQICSWSIFSEMGFDVVSINLTSGEQMVWIDKYNDLLDCLRQIAKENEIC